MLVADAPVAGLRASAVPNGADVPNNHLAYAVQWFLFAAAAAAIYILALRRRRRYARGRHGLYQHAPHGEDPRSSCRDAGRASERPRPHYHRTSALVRQWMDCLGSLVGRRLHNKKQP